MNGPRVEYEAVAMVCGAVWVAALTLGALLIFSDQASVGATIGRVFLVGVAGMGLFAWHVRRPARNGEDHSRDAIQPPILGADDGVLLTKNVEGSAR
jgi:hypothetical protein